MFMYFIKNISFIGHIKYYTFHTYMMYFLKTKNKSVSNPFFKIVHWGGYLPGIFLNPYLIFLGFSS